MFYDMTLLTISVPF